MKINGKRILLVCNESNSTINFRKEFIIYLKTKGYEVFVTSKDSERQEDIEKLGVTFFEIKFDNRSKKISSLKVFKKSLSKVVDLVKPDVVFSFMLKPNIVVPIVCKEKNIQNVYSMVEGLGDPFQPKTIIQKITRFIVCVLLRHSFKQCKKVFVLNNDDKSELIKRKVLHDTKIMVIPGIGIDTRVFYPEESVPNAKRVVMFARLLKSKGIIDYCEVAKIVREKRKDIEFELYGQEAEIKATDLKPYIDSQIIKYCGFTKNSKEIMLSSRILVSTSFYREGMPRVILEAMALGKPVIASNTVGSKDLVKNGVTGYLFNMHDTDKCAELIQRLIDDDEMLLKLGRAAREECVNKYDSDRVNKIIVDVIENN